MRGREPVCPESRKAVSIHAQSANATISLRYKITLVVFGLFLSLCSIETALRAGEFIVLTLQEWGNRHPSGSPGIYRILCLGESTTQNHWPPILREILNRSKAGVSFNTIDLGLGGTNTAAIVQKLPDNIRKYRPDMVITMMGINDYGAHIPVEFTLDSTGNRFFARVKAYKLFSFLVLRIKTKMSMVFGPRKEKRAGICTDSVDETALINLGRRCWSRGAYQEAEKLLWRAIRCNPRNPAAYSLLRGCYREDGHYEEAIALMKKLVESQPDNFIAYGELAVYHSEFGQYYQGKVDFRLIENLFRKAISLNPRYETAFIDLSLLYLNWGDYAGAEKMLLECLAGNPRSSFVYLSLGWLYRDHGTPRYALAEKMFKKAIEMQPNHIVSYLELGRNYRMAGEPEKAEKAYIKALELDPQSITAHRALMELYREEGQMDLAELHSKQVEALTRNRCFYQTVNNYRKLREILASQNIPYICVQYPMRRVRVLQEIFGDDRAGIFFVDNESSFKSAVKQKGYNVYFTDDFAGDFGHCTHEGNRLLAGNIAQVILNSVFHYK
jgi:tetratricopeptide (TPR) repeat protein